MLVIKTITVEYLECDVCGSIFTSAEEAEEHGCNRNLSPKFKVDDTVWAQFKVGAGMEALGEEMAKGKVTKVITNLQLRPLGDVKIFTLAFNTRILGVNAPIHAHEVYYVVEPIEQHPEYPHRSYVAGTFKESLLSKA